MAGKPALDFLLNQHPSKPIRHLQHRGPIIYALLVAGALLSASYTFRKLKADRQQLSRNHCACLVILILSCLGYTLTYVVVGLRQLL